MRRHRNLDRRRKLQKMPAAMRNRKIVAYEGVLPKFFLAEKGKVKGISPANAAQQKNPMGVRGPETQALTFGAPQENLVTSVLLLASVLLSVLLLA